MNTTPSLPSSTPLATIRATPTAVRTAPFRDGAYRELLRRLHEAGV